MGAYEVNPEEDEPGDADEGDGDEEKYAGLHEVEGDEEDSEHDQERGDFDEEAVEREAAEGAALTTRGAADEEDGVAEQSGNEGGDERDDRVEYADPEALGVELDGGEADVTLHEDFKGAG